MKTRRFSVVLAALLFLIPASARAQGGINLSWDDCGSFGHELEAFACDTNAGSDLLYVSAAAPVDMPQLLGAEFWITFALSNPAPLSPWWHMESTGCRPTGMGEAADFTAGPFSCIDPWQGNASGGVVWQSAYQQPNWGQLRGVVAIPGTVALPANTEAYVVAIQVNHLKTVGAGSCAGCNNPACIVLTQVLLAQPVGVGDYTITNALSRQTASWVCPSIFYSGGAPFEPPPGCQSSCPVPSRKQSWGSIKSMYR